MEDDYRQPSPYVGDIFTEGPSWHLNDSIARIEALKLRILGNHRLMEFERSELLAELNTLRAAYLHLGAQSAQPGPSGSDPQRLPVSVPTREDLELEGILGTNPQITANLDRIARVAPSKLTVLLEGETGSGKELFARIIHLNSQRTKFVAVNCGALPSGVIESELFGHVKGAFTGATSDRKGRFEEANGGTIFLDEIGELEPQAQVKLLRTLDVGEIQRVGSDRVQKVDVRVIAATNRNLERMVAEGTFREDLYYRLNICHIMIPPLRERRDEIPILLDYFIRKTCAEVGRPLPVLDKKLQDFLISDYHYPGNIRELRNLALYIAHIYAGEPVRLSDLSERYTRAYGERLSRRAVEQGGAYKQVRNQAERGHLIGMLTRHKGDIRAVCAEMNVSRARLYQLLKKHGIRPSNYREV